MGYIGQKRSVRSQEAINNGLLTKNQLKAWEKRAAEKGVVSPCEWHHTGKYFNKTEYYNPDDFKNLNPKDFPPVKKEKSQKEDFWYVLVSAEWGGTKRFRKIVGVNVVVKDKITSAQRSANKYCLYGGYIEKFNTKEEAENFAQTAELRK